MTRKGCAGMNEKLKRLAAFQQAVQKKMDRWIDHLSRNAIEQEERKYELVYGKPLSEKERMEIKKGVVVRYAVLLAVPLLILLLTLMNRGVIG
ncbi:hypothetical protein [Planomicrobium okeanokoites]|uniref:Uncharacterized protein n=2 Tax=Planomicrobium okeanokoites TaxID=244 RepID=A0ABV7KMU0_PLAOK|nr:hypothetical protein [Planomicrobium okeanokoites]TAA65727.1 hypothetical protein D2910_16200 [Planomicrobium okeanokoites]